MLYKALISFSGILSMAKDEVREISDSSLVSDLLKAGYIMEMKADESKKPKEEKRRKSR